MRIHNPFYLAFSLALCGFVAVANHNGWSLFRTVGKHTWSNAFTGPHHK